MAGKAPKFYWKDYDADLPLLREAVECGDVNALAGHLRRISLEMVRNADREGSLVNDREDIAQEMVISVLADVPKWFEEHTGVITFTYLDYALRNNLRSRRRVAARMQEEEYETSVLMALKNLVEDGEEPVALRYEHEQEEVGYARVEARDLLLHLLKGCTKRQREVLLVLLECDMNFSRAARRLGVSHQAVMTVLNTVRAKVREEDEEDEKETVA